MIIRIALRDDLWVGNSGQINAESRLLHPLVSEPDFLFLFFTTLQA